ncbi:MAG TPA: NADH-quinone oxidoreductase subunit M, partial [Desulfopila sp.]|nr:NADH-quinone oxidoreductase subunit M [Desulfopila sp.]
LAAIPGAILAAAYMLRMLQKVVWGGTENPDQSWQKDLNIREIVTLTPFLFFVFWIGLDAKTFVNMMHISVATLLDKLHSHHQQALAAADLILR